MKAVRIPHRHRVRRGFSMRRSRLAVAAAIVVGIAGFTAAATVAGDQKRDFETDMVGYEEVPSISTNGVGSVDVQVARDGDSFKFELRYRDLGSPVTQSHIHFGQKSVNGGISVFFCSNLANPPAGTPACPQPAPGEFATVEGTRTAADVIGPAGQGIAAGEFEELVRALRAGVTYANVHSTQFPGGEIRGQFDQRGHQED
jgi:CHRD domain